MHISTTRNQSVSRDRRAPVGTQVWEGGRAQLNIPSGRRNQKFGGHRGGGEPLRSPGSPGSDLGSALDQLWNSFGISPGTALG